MVAAASSSFESCSAVKSAFRTYLDVTRRDCTYHSTLHLGRFAVNTRKSARNCSIAEELQAGESGVTKSHQILPFTCHSSIVDFTPFSSMRRHFFKSYTHFLALLISHK